MLEFSHHRSLLLSVVEGADASTKGIRLARINEDNHIIFLY
jgi:hypothetical protein